MPTISSHYVGNTESDEEAKQHVLHVGSLWLQKDLAPATLISTTRTDFSRTVRQDPLYFVNLKQSEPFLLPTANIVLIRLKHHEDAPRVVPRLLNKMKMMTLTPMLAWTASPIQLSILGLLFYICASSFPDFNCRRTFMFRGLPIKETTTLIQISALTFPGSSNDRHHECAKALL